MTSWYADEYERDGIRVSHVYPPIPMRNFDWSATRDGYEPGDVIGWGFTAEDAIRDLLQEERDRAAPDEPDGPECSKCGRTIVGSHLQCSSEWGWRR